MKENFSRPATFVVTIPGSKSISHRCLIASALAEGKSALFNALRCEDTAFTAASLRTMGASILDEDGIIQVTGSAGELRPGGDGAFLSVGNSGTSFRLLLSVAALAEGPVTISGSDRMNQRPIAPLVESLRTLGARIEYLGNEGYPPVAVRSCGLRGGEVHISAKESSQYISSILLCAPYAASDVTVHVRENPVSHPYIDLTLETMKEFGVTADREGYRRFRVPSGSCYRARDITVQGDASSASYFWAAAAVTGQTVVTENIDALGTLQGDAAFLEVLEETGCRVIREKGRVEVQGGHLRSVDMDMSAMPDMVPTLAAVALFCPGTTRIRNIAHLRYKESDRIAAIAREWSKMGAQILEEPDGLTIRGGLPLKRAAIDPHDDHRIAMSAAVAGLRVPLQIENPGCVEKSFPDFWELWKNLRRRFKNR